MIARAVLVTLALLAGAEATPSRDPAHTFLATAFDVTPADMGRVDAGQVVSRTLDVSHNREVATLGIVRIATTPEFYVERLTDIASFKRILTAALIGTASTRPVEKLTASIPSYRLTPNRTSSRPASARPSGDRNSNSPG